MSLRTTPTDRPISADPSDNLRTPRTTRANVLVTPTDTPTDTTDSAAYGHDWGVYRHPSVVTCPKCTSERVLIGPSYDRNAMRCSNCGNTWRHEP